MIIKLMRWLFKRKQCNVTNHQLADLVEVTVRSMVDGNVEIYQGSVGLEIVVSGVSKGSLYYKTLRKAAWSASKFYKLIRNQVK